MSKFLQLIRLELYAFLTRSELNTFQAVCSQWKAEISRRSHLLAILFSGELEISLFKGALESFPLTRSVFHEATVCDDIAVKLVGEQLFPHAQVEDTVSIRLAENGYGNLLRQAFRNELILDVSVTLLRALYELHGKCLSRFQLSFYKIEEPTDSSDILNPLLFELLSEVVGQTYTIHFAEGRNDLSHRCLRTDASLV